MEILNLGCGKPHHYTPRQHDAVELDIWRPYLRGKKNPVWADARALPFRSGSFDVVIALKLLEHLTRQEGLNMVPEMERLARKLVVITTPKLFFTQPPLDGNPYQRHLSHFKREDFPGYSYFEISAPWGPFMFFVKYMVRATGFEPGPPLTLNAQDAIDRLISAIEVIS